MMTTVMGSFAEDVKNAFELRYPGEKVEIKKVTKNNGVVYTGITVSAEGEHVFPTLYLEPFAEEAGEEGITEDLVDRMCRIYESRRVGNTVSFDHLRHYSSVKDRLRCKLINYSANEERLESIPHRRFLDLAIVPYCLVNESELSCRLPGEASFMVTSGNLSMWGVDADTVLDDAIENTYAYEEPHITGIYEMLRKLNPAFDFPIEEDDCPMYVMTTEGGHGAVSMIFEEEIKSFCESVGSDVYVIPSSTSEILLVPVRDGMRKEQIDEMICDINATELDPVSVLSDHVYYYDKDTGYKVA